MQSTDLQSAAYVSLIDEGVTLFAKEEHKAALDVFWKAFRLRPGAPVVLFNIGRTMEELNDPRCEDFYTAAASQGNVDAHYQLALLCVEFDRKGEAVEHLKAYLKGSKVDDGDAAWARETLQTLCPRPILIWKNPNRIIKKLPQKSVQNNVKFGIL